VVKKSEFYICFAVLCVCLNLDPKEKKQVTQEKRGGEPITGGRGAF